jgi:hypothetical protein
MASPKTPAHNYHHCVRGGKCPDSWAQFDAITTGHMQIKNDHMRMELSKRHRLRAGASVPICVADRVVAVSSIAKWWLCRIHHRRLGRVLIPCPPEQANFATPAIKKPARAVRPRRAATRSCPHLGKARSAVLEVGTNSLKVRGWMERKIVDARWA